ncbi:MAG: helix-turn-helix domain-containing protein [Pseudonocardiales bacterium]|nr:helix-turn-helix domain-containing protein [Pseudonocardiales bacterium]
MLTVETDAACVERRLGSGGLACPGCSGVLAGWGHARARDVRDRGGLLRLVPRRARCTSCGATHVLLPVLVLARRADVASMIGTALAAKARGLGHRRIAAELGRSAETVRGWLRRFAGRIEAVRVVFTGWCRALAADPVLPGPAGSAWADAIAAVSAAACALGSRFGLGEVPVWAVASAISGGRLLAPGWPEETINTS